MSIYKTYKKHAGGFKINVSEPSPRWVVIERENGHFFGHLQKDDLIDLKYLIERALDFIEKDGE